MGTARRQTDLGLRPESGRKSDPEEIAFPGRRSFLSVLLGVGTVTMGALLSVPLARFTLYPLFARTTETKWSDLGAVKEFSSITIGATLPPDKLAGVLRHPTEKMTAGGMPPVNVTDEEMTALVAYLDSLK